MFGEAGFTAAKFLGLGFGHGRIRFFLRDAVPQVLNKLEALGATEGEDRGEFAVHGGKLMGRAPFRQARAARPRRAAAVLPVQDVVRNERKQPRQC
jgi:hypothetical protein